MLHKKLVKYFEDFFKNHAIIKTILLPILRGIHCESRARERTLSVFTIFPWENTHLKVNLCDKLENRTSNICISE